VVLSYLASREVPLRDRKYQGKSFKKHILYWGLDLQKLAPGLDSIECFSQEADCLGDKETLERQIREITEIAVLALQGALLSQFNVESRQTTRKEERHTRYLTFLYSNTFLLGRREKESVKAAPRRPTNLQRTKRLTSSAKRIARSSQHWQICREADYHNVLYLTTPQNSKL